MLWIVILHEAVIWKFLVDERNQIASQNITIEVSKHDSFKDANLCSAMSAYSSPHVYFQRMLRLWLSLGWFANFLVTGSAELFKGDRTFVTKNDVVERISCL